MLTTLHAHVCVCVCACARACVCVCVSHMDSCKLFAQVLMEYPGPTRRVLQDNGGCM